MLEGLSKSVKPQDEDDVRFAARLVLEGFCDQELIQAVLSKQRELLQRDKPLTIAQICVKKGWLSRSEAQFMLRENEPPPVLVPGYRIEGLLGHGGMSRVFRAHDEAAGRDVALKILKPNLARNPRALARFRREAELLTRFDHPNIVKGYDFVEHDGLFAFAMELIPGRELLELLDEGGSFQEDAALYVILQTARALTEMYRHAVVHRDVKPGNILVTRDNTVKLCDLGLATGAEGDEETEGLTVGTVEYISPEQALGEAVVDVRSDIYALGVTLYHLVVGEIPFQGEDDQETMGKRFVESLSSHELSGLSPHLHYFIQKMMATDKEIRYQSPEELIENIEEQIEGKKTLGVNPLSALSGDSELDRPFADEDKSEDSRSRHRRNVSFGFRPSAISVGVGVDS